MKVMILGDTHGNTRHTLALIRRMKYHQADAAIVVGDFGLWDHAFNGIDFLDQLQTVLAEEDKVLVWLDGNHENHDRLDWYVENNPKSKNGMTYIRSRILYSPRGNHWTWDGKKFMTVGGAVSIDKDYRLMRERGGNIGPRNEYVPGSGARTQWWPGEQLTDDDVEIIDVKMEVRRAQGKREIDYLFTHDCSDRTPWKNRLKPDLDSKIHRQRIDQVLRSVQPKMHFHGHMHEKYDWMNPIFGSGLAGDESTAWVQTYGLECDKMLYSWGILDTKTDEFVFAPPIMS